MSRIRSIVIHGHFYQPPREDPWLEEVESEASAAPYHDWNERIERECYRAVVAARVADDDGRIERMVNTLSSISFNFGPTLLEWMEREAPETYASILEADHVSRERHGGHGNAIAQPYHHAILPLSSRRDKTTEARWGIADFKRRFGRGPAGMWLPETAVDDETLDVLAREGILFTILAPHQVVEAPAGGHPGLYRTSTGRTIALFIYDGPVSHGIAFGGLLNDAHGWAERMVAGSDKHQRPHLVSAATDGETYGHHHRFGEMALARVLDLLDRKKGVLVENFASFLERHPAEQEVKLVAPTAWSCVHGVERWRSDCGCRIAPDGKTNQRWRAPLRDAIEELAEGLHALFEREGARYFENPWAARDAYGAVVGAGGDGLRRFAHKWIGASNHADADARAERAPSDVVRARELLELERDALRMFTSCAWFFDDIGGLEPLQVLRYAARALELAGTDGPRLEKKFLAHLAEAKSNVKTKGTGRDIYMRSAKPRIPPMARVAAGHFAVRRLAPGAGELPSVCCSARDNGDSIVVTQQRTGRTHEFRVSLEKRALDQASSPESTGASSDELMAADDISIIVRPADGEGTSPQRLSISDLPERHRFAIASALRRQLLDRCLSAEEMALLASGEAELGEVVPRALTRAVASLEKDCSPPAIARAIELVELLEQLGLHIPFGAQKEFHRVRSGICADEASALARVGRRLGFAAEMRSPV